jgi:UDP-GlcNAc3NAcA epimerase
MKILSVVGARPQFIKASVVSRAIVAKEKLLEVMVHTGQHFDDKMSKIFFDELDIQEPAYNLGINGGGHGEMTGRMLEGLERIIQAEQPDKVLVYGDTNSTLAGALAAVKLKIPVAHVEAGLRSFNRAMPEEVNRVLVDHISELLFCPTKASVENLTGEGLLDGVYLTGDVMFDATLHAIEASQERSKIISRLGLNKGEYAIATVHRAENTADRESLSSITNWLERMAQQQPVILLLHPRTRQAVEEYGIIFNNVRVCDPVGYFDIAQLLAGCVAVYTDSGGLQKEAFFHRKPCVTLRGETEWVETISAGWNRLWKTPEYLPRKNINEYGDGDSGAVIVDAIMNQ